MAGERNGKRWWLVLPASLAIALSLLTPAQAGARATKVDWTQFGFDLQRTGYNPSETTLGVGNVGGLHLLWSFSLGVGTVVQPTFATGVIVNGHATDLVLIGAGGTLFAAGFGSDDQRLRAVRGVEAALEFEVLHATLLATVVFQRDFQSIGSAMKLAGDI